MLISSAFTIQAQNSTTYDRQLKEGESLFEYRGKAVDTLGIGKTTFSYSFFKPSVHSQEAYFEIGLDSISGTAASTTIAFQSKKNIFAAWATDLTDYWAGTTSDTTIN